MTPNPDQINQTLNRIHDGAYSKAFEEVQNSWRNKSPQAIATDFLSVKEDAIAPALYDSGLPEDVVEEVLAVCENIAWKFQELSMKQGSRGTTRSTS